MHGRRNDPTCDLIAVLQGSGQCIVRPVRIPDETVGTGGTNYSLHNPPAECVALRDV